MKVEATAWKSKTRPKLGSKTRLLFQANLNEHADDADVALGGGHVQRRGAGARVRPQQRRRTRRVVAVQPPAHVGHHLALLLAPRRLAVDSWMTQKIRSNMKLVSCDAIVFVSLLPCSLWTALMTSVEKKWVSLEFFLLFFLNKCDSFQDRIRNETTER